MQESARSEPPYEREIVLLLAAVPLGWLSSPQPQGDLMSLLDFRPGRVRQELLVVLSVLGGMGTDDLGRARGRQPCLGMWVKEDTVLARGAD